ncbi:MAG: phenylalanine--tRNA ligase beta subunit-related protein [Patescibacteria group bacterium]
MQLRIQKELVEIFHPVIGVVDTRGVDNAKTLPEVGALLEEVAEGTRNYFATLESPAKHPHIAAWRGAYKKFGSDPHEYRCSAEALVRRVLKGGSLPRINTLVDLYNLISLKYVLPVGGENTDAIEGDLVLALASGTEEFIRLNGTENEPPKQGEAVYKDDGGVVCRRWNWREAERTKMTPETVNAIIVIDAVAPIERSAVEVATEELATLVKRYCGGEVRSEVRTA